MKMFNNIYLGWNNPRKAGHLIGHNIAILVQGEDAVVLEGDKARAFLEDYLDLHNHLMGFSWSAKAERILRSVDAYTDDRDAYNPVFDVHWEMGRKKDLDSDQGEHEAETIEDEIYSTGLGPS